MSDGSAGPKGGEPQTPYRLIDGDAAARRDFSAIVEAMRRHPAYAGERDVAAMRAGSKAFAASAIALPVPDGVVATPTDRLEITRFARDGETANAPVLYFHGGGYVIGSVEASRGIAASLSAALRAPVFAVGYRQAPEYPFPAALEDALAAYDWLVERTDRGILLVGDSAGGTIAVGLALAAARSGRRRARAVVACSAWFDLQMRGESWQSNRDRDVVSSDLGVFFRNLYLGKVDPVLADAMLEAGLDRLPPLLIQIGEAEGARDDALAYAERARAAGAPVDVELFRDMPHNFMKFRSPISQSAIDRIADWARGIAAD